jgi:hypothetical protein
MNLSVEIDLLRFSYLLCMMGLDRMGFDVGVLPHTQNPTPFVVDDSGDLLSLFSGH